ncbi:MAG: GTP 3',8-cyclase MoaA [Candidatus Obscuribacterales bacterium]|nr:GTP 3',8-cyclase MoaA [Candidatus Obscuribacterales bacterium]
MNQLIDNYGREHTYLRISVTDRCNLRCSYCMPPEGLKWKTKDNILTFEEIIRIARVFVDLGISKIRLTGGEPLVRKDLPFLVHQLSRLEGLSTIAMTTNGVLLSGQAQVLKDAGLTSLNISLDTLDRIRFAELTKRDDYEAVMKGINAALEIGFSSLKMNMVVIKGVNDDEVVDMVNWAKDKPINVRFIEYMPFKDNHWRPQGVFSYCEMRDAIEKQFKLIPLELTPGAVAKDFAIEGHIGKVSFITSMTESFCSSCNRLRLTADGSVKSCLFYLPEVNLKDVLRKGISDSELALLIQSAVLMKPEAHPPMEELANTANRTMIEIGG